MFLHTFHQSIAHINDSSNFDSSFEVKYIPTTEHLANRDITQCDREALIRFVQEFEALQSYNNSATKSTPKKSPHPIREISNIYDSILTGNISSVRSLTQSPTEPPLLRNHHFSNSLSSDGDFLMDNKSVDSLISNRSELNSFCRSTMGCKPLSCCDFDEDLDDGIDLMGSHNNSSTDDSVFDMHPPLLPSFNVTPPKQTRSAAHELARFLRGSFHVKRAKVTHLRRSFSANEYLENNESTDDNGVDEDVGKLKLSKHGKVKKKILEDTTNRNSGNSIYTRIFNTNTSPFRRAWEQSSFRTPRSDKYAQSPQPLTNPAQRRSISMSTTHNAQLQHDDPKRPLRTHSEKMTHSKSPRVSAWAISFEHLLEDAAGLATFAEFLKMEFSAENIYFWTSCERYKSTDNQNERQTQAKQIYRKYISNGCSEPVNLDAQSRNVSDEALENADRDLFAKAQKQIYHLMKFDSYQRFIRSDLYKNCLRAEEKDQPLPYGADSLDALLKTNFLQSASPKLKKSASNAEDRRRKILLPWHRKTRSKSRDRMDDDSTHPPINHHHHEPAHGSSSALNTLLLPSLKLGALTTAKSSEDCYTQTLRSSLPSSLKSLNAGCSLCRVKFSDEATTIVQIRPNETVGQLVDRLLEKRGLRYNLYDVVIKSHSKTIDLDTPSQEIAGEEVEIEQRVTFKLYLPDPKVISVKSKPKKLLHEVVGSILQKYNYDTEAVDVLRRDTMERVDLAQLVTTADGQRLHVVLRKPPKVADSNNGAADYQNDNIAFNFMKSKELANEFTARNAKNNVRNTSVSSSESNLDEITNNIFHDIIKEKTKPKSVSELADQYSLKSDECGSEISVFGDSLNNRRGAHISNSNLRLRGKSVTSTNQYSTEADLNKPIIAKLKAGVKLQVTEIVAEKQDELLLSLKSRLDNQSTTSAVGLQLKELPEYLRNKENQCETALNLRHIRANLSPVNKPPQTSAHCNTETPPPPVERSHSMTRQLLKVKHSSLSTNEEEEFLSQPNADETNAAYKGPPPLPPKPKVLPTKPSNWGANISD